MALIHGEHATRQPRSIRTTAALSSTTQRRPPSHLRSPHPASAPQRVFTEAQDIAAAGRHGSQRSRDLHSPLMSQQQSHRSRHNSGRRRERTGQCCAFFGRRNNIAYSQTTSCSAPDSPPTIPFPSVRRLHVFTKPCLLSLFPYSPSANLTSVVVVNSPSILASSVRYARSLNLGGHRGFGPRWERPREPAA